MTTAAPAAPAAPATPAAPAPGAPGTDLSKAAPKPGEAPKPNSPAPDVPASKKKKYTVDGADVEIDLSDEKALDALIQKGLGADKRFKEASKWRQESEMLVELLRTNPMAVIEKAMEMSGGDKKKARDIVENWLWENHIKLEQMTPEQKKAHEQQQELERLRSDKKKQEQAEQQKKFEELRQTYRQTFERDIMGALETGGLPKTTRTVQRMAYYMHQALKTGVKLEAKDVLPLVRQDYEADIKDLFGPMNGEMLAKLLGDETLKKIREHDLAKVRGGGGQPPAQPPAAPPAAPKEKEILTPDQWRERLDKRLGK